MATVAEQTANESWQQLAAKAFPRASAAGTVSGEGNFALLACCDGRNPRRIILFSDEASRRKALIRLDFGCGVTRCTADHKLIDLA
ncbi:MAG: hypothetical protein ACREDR_42335 [Blastocatellia bacterium]